MRLVFDIEANGLLDTVTRMWCVVVKDIDSQKVYTFGEEEFDQALTLLSKATLLIGHNILQYDIPLLRKLFGWKVSRKTTLRDTYVLSRLYNPDRKRPTGYPGKAGPHSLECWGYRVGRYKPEHEDWSVYSDSMLHRCCEDVEINHLVYNELENEAKGNDWSTAIYIEQEIARIMGEQEQRGVPFDKIKAIKYVWELTADLICIDDELSRNTPAIPLPPSKIKSVCSKPYTANGNYSAVCLRQVGWKIIQDPAYRPKPNEPYLTHAPIDFGSASQVKDYLLSCGWKPTQYNYKKVTARDSEDPYSPYFGQQIGKFARGESGEPVQASPKLTEDSFDETLGVVPGLVMKRRVRSHRRSQIVGWIESCRSDGTIPAGADSCGTNTRRMKHRKVVNVPGTTTYDDEEHELYGDIIWDVDEQKIFFGAQMRSLFYAPGDWEFVGYDASALEARMEAHYTYPYDGGAYAKEVLEGDIHTTNAEGWEVSRRIAKSGKYAVTYGCSPAKLATTLGKSKELGDMLYEAFWTINTALAGFKDDCVKEWEGNNRQFILGIDGSRIHSRSKHSLVNAKFQSAGSITMKLAAVLLDKEARKKKIRGYKVIDMHDEGQWVCHKKDSKKLTKLMIDSVVKAGELLNFNIPLAAEAVIGKNWAETH